MVGGTVGGPPPAVTLVTGGVRSGKSRYALDLAEGTPRCAFIATAEPFDEEMRWRIDRHRQERGERFLTLEEPLDLAGALLRLPAATEVAVVDCLTVWLGNLFHRREGEGLPGGLGDLPEVSGFLAALAAPRCRLVVVTNEVGLGVTPATPLGRRFCDLAGRLNQEVAARAARVVLLVSGLPWTLKGEGA